MGALPQSMYLSIVPRKVHQTLVGSGDMTSFKSSVRIRVEPIPANIRAF